MAELYERKKDYNLVQNQENIFQENKEFLLSLKESEWRQKTLEERIIAAQKMVRLETERLGIPEIPLYVKETGSRIALHYIIMKRTKYGMLQSI